MAVVNKDMLAQEIAAQTGSTKTDAEKFMEALEKTVTDHVAAGDEVKISGFLAVTTAMRSARTVKNPRTGEDHEVPEQRVVKVRPMSRLRNAVHSEG